MLKALFLLKKGLVIMTAVMCEDYCKRRDDGEINQLQGYKASNGESSGAWGGNWICIGVC